MQRSSCKIDKVDFLDDFSVKSLLLVNLDHRVYCLLYVELLQVLLELTCSDSAEVKETLNHKVDDKSRGVVDFHPLLQFLCQKILVCPLLHFDNLILEQNVLGKNGI
jgi:hypothetical protein